MGYLFENAEKMDIQAERRNTREAREKAAAAEARATSAEKKLESAEDRAMSAQNSMRGLLGRLVGLCREEGLTKEETRIRLFEFYQVSESDLNIYFEGIWKEN